MVFPPPPAATAQVRESEKSLRRQKEDSESQVGEHKSVTADLKSQVSRLTQELRQAQEEVSGNGNGGGCGGDSRAALVSVGIHAVIA